MNDSFSPEEVESKFHDRCAMKGKEADFIEWCQENEEDPTDPDATYRYNEIQAELGDIFWEGKRSEDREGYEAMIADD